MLYPAELRKHLIIISESYIANNNNNFFHEIYHAKEIPEKFVFKHYLALEFRVKVYFLFWPKRLSEKEQILISFTNGKSINDLSSDFKCTKLTITRNLKRNLGEKKYKELIEMNLSSAKKVRMVMQKSFLIIKMNLIKKMMKITLN